MHKRILAIFVALVLLFCICAIPAAADSADEDLPYIELTKFDDSMVMGIQPGAFYVMGDYGYVLDFSVTLGQINAYGYEITYSWTGNRPNVTGVSFGNTTDNSFRNYYVDGTNLGKIRGSFNGSVGSDVGISFISSGCYVTVHSVRVFLVENFQVELSAYLYGNGTGVTWTPGSSASVSTTGYGSIEIDSWRNYDMINVSATLGGYGITSVSARLMDNTSDLEIVIPFEMNYINLSDYNGEHENTLLTISCDMRGVDPATAPDSTLIIGITTSVPSGNYGYIQPTSIYGTILVESPDVYLPWLKGFLLSFTSWFDTLFFKIDNLDSNLVNFRNMFSSFSEEAFAFYDDIKNTVTSSFDDFKTFWNSSLDDKIISFESWYRQFEVEKMEALVSVGFNPIFDKLDSLNQGTPVDPSVSQGMTSAGQELADLGQAMAAGTPQVNTQVQVSVPEVPDDGSGILATTMFNFFWQQDYILKMLLTVVALATISYIFFGKKG